MHFFVNNESKVIFGWSGKSGCSHVKKIYYFFCNNIDKEIHNDDEYEQELPHYIQEYTCILFIRNPYKRLVSGFLHRYKKGGTQRHLFKHDKVTFSTFVSELIKNDWVMIFQNHFSLQTSACFDEKILNSKVIKFFDIENIDYSYIENLYNKKIPESVINKKFGHERCSVVKTNVVIESPVYDLDMIEYYKFHVDHKYFYNEELKNQVFQFYEKDFNFFKDKGIEYTL